MSTRAGFLSVKHAETGSWVFNAANLETDDNAIGYNETIIAGTFNIDMDTFVVAVGGAAVAIPVGAEIRGVSAVLKYLSREGANVVPITIQLRGAAGLLGTAKNEAGSMIKVTANLGGAADLWGATLTPAIINSTDFGMRVEFTFVGLVGPGADCWGYYLIITIHYSNVSDISPGGGEVLRDNHTETITWTASTEATNVEIDLYKGGVLLTNIASGVVAALGTYDWEIDVDEAGTDYTIRITDNGSGDVANSAADFTILISAEKTLENALTAYAPLVALVGAEIDRVRFLQGTTAVPLSLPRIVFQRIFTTKEQVITGAIVSRSVRFQITCYSDSSVEATTVAEVVEEALLSSIGTFADVTLRDEKSEWNPDAELYERLVEADCLESA